MPDAAQAIKEMEALDYPGRRKPVNRQPSKVTVDTPLWDARPVYYPHNGVQSEFFVISDVARAIGYSVASIRAWEAAGLLPRSGLRAPSTKGKPTAGGRSHKGKRLWTRAQIEAILRLARKHKVLLNRQPPTKAFAVEVANQFHELAGEK